MPITTSAKKALRQSFKRRTRNLERTAAYKKVAKNIRKEVAAGNRERAQTLIPALYKALDKAAKTHTIHPNKAARLKSRLTKKMSATH